MAEFLLLTISSPAFAIQDTPDGSGVPPADLYYTIVEVKVDLCNVHDAKLTVDGATPTGRDDASV
jgi:hypothetical protein